ncbi:uncharacterized protein LOC119383412 [Rhipicephalus sanguineus]|uniref:uncharacterized protein LOC119383412 n=1 Tax=Rhipicephalus sanguineus TaxID=34632 RepID=UPI0020C1F914|nr:uncharacterized protein LOC119383412 [Rhipicephalus sanguineus]
MESRPVSPENYSLQRYFNSIVSVSPTRTDVQGLVGVPPQSPAVMSDDCVQTSRAQADEPEQCVPTVDCSVAKDPDNSAALSPLRRFSKRIAIRVSCSGETSNSPATVDKDDNIGKRLGGSSARKRRKLSNGARSSGDEAKCSDVSEHNQGTRTLGAPQDHCQAPAVQEDELLGDHTPLFTLRSKRPSAHILQEAKTSKPENETTGMCQQVKQNIQTAADSKQKSEQMARGSRSEHKRKRPQSQSSSSSICSPNGKGPKPTPLISRDLWTSTGPRTSPKSRSHAKNRALSKSARAHENYKRFMKEVFPQLVKEKSPWAWSGISATSDSAKSAQSSRSPRKSPLAETAEPKVSRPTAHREGAPVGKRSFWYVPKALKSQDSATDKNTGRASTSVFNGARVFRYRTGLLQKRAELEKRLEKSQHDAVLPEVGEERPVRRETPKNGASEEPCETQRNEFRTSKASLVRDSPIETVQPKRSFWQNSGRRLNKPAWRARSPVAEFAKEKTPPKVPATRRELLNKTGGEEEEEDEDAWIWSLWRQREVELAKAAEMRSTKALSTTRPSRKVSKLSALDSPCKEPPKPPKGVQHKVNDAVVQTSGLQNEAKTSGLQREAKDAAVQTSFVCMIGRNITLDRTARKRLRGAFHTTEEELQFMDMPLEQAGGVSGITFGNYFSTRTATMGVMRLGPNSEKPLSANNDNDMFLYALDNGMNITTLGGTWMILRKGSTFYVCRGLPFTLRNLGLTTCKVLYVLTEPCEADSVE